MLIAERLRKTNRAEYLLYLWQLEDILRACGCDEMRVNEFLKAGPEAARGYAVLCEMMRSEGVKEHGHLQLSKNVLAEMVELHDKLLASPKFPYYKQMYLKVLPFIVEVRRKQGERPKGELEVCFEMLYGVLLLRLQKKEVSEATEAAVKEVSTLLGQLSDYYFKDREKPLEF